MSQIHFDMVEVSDEELIRRDIEARERLNFYAKIGFFMSGFVVGCVVVLVTCLIVLSL